MKKVKIGVDLHGVLDKNKETIKFFKLNLPILRETHEIFVVSGPPEDEVRCELIELGYKEKVHFDGVFSIVDFLKESGAKMWQDSKLTWWTDNETWWSSKAKICKKNKISVMVDDHKEYEEYFKDTGISFVLV